MQLPRSSGVDYISCCVDHYDIGRLCPWFHHGDGNYCWCDEVHVASGAQLWMYERFEDARLGASDQRSLSSEKGGVSPTEWKLLRLKEVTTILEIALWMIKITNHSLIENVTFHQKKIKIKTDESSVCQQCCVACGADVVMVMCYRF